MAEPTPERRPDRDDHDDRDDDRGREGAPGDPSGRWRPTPFLAGAVGVSAAALAGLAAAPARWRLALAALAASHAAMAAAGMTPRSRLLGPNLTRLPEAAARRGEVGLSFDDGPDPEVTPAVLDLLDRRGARATFFAIGRRVEAWPGLAAEAAARGHQVENHTYRHTPGFAFLGPRGMAREVGRAQEAIAAATGRRPALFRAPAGLRNPWLDPVLWRQGLALASWTRRGFDTVSAEPERVAARLLRGLAPGDVLLLHDGSAARGRSRRPVVLDVLPRLLDEIAARGLEAVPIPGPGEEADRSASGGDTMVDTSRRTT